MATDPTDRTSPRSGVAPDGKANRYFHNIGEAARTLLHGLKLTWRHFLQARSKREPMGVEADNYFDQQTGVVTLQYPRESLPVPDNARYRLHNEIDDCIVCDKCAKICPVDCIEIEPIKATETIGLTSDGTPKRLYAARFDIDMAKCCFCGLCTTVCPTECLTMTKTYDFSEFDVAEHTYAFAEMTPLEILQKRKELEAFQAQKAAKATTAAAAKPGMARPATAARPAVAPKPTTTSSAQEMQDTARKLMEQKRADQTPNPVPQSAPTPEGTEAAAPAEASKPAFRPRPMMKPKPAAPRVEDDSDQGKVTSASPSAPEGAEKAPPRSRPVMKPVIKKTDDVSAAEATNEQDTTQPVARPKPVMKPVIKKTATGEAAEDQPPKPRPVIKPVTRGEAAPEASVPLESSAPAGEEKPKPRPVIKPVIPKPEPEGAAGEAEPAADAPKKPRPVIKPVVPKAPMQKAPTPEEKKAGDGDIKGPKPIVNPKEVVRKPPQEDKSEEDKQQEDSQRPAPPGHPD